MPAKVMETVVIPIIKEAYSYDISSDGQAVFFLITDPRVILQGAVIDYADLDMLSTQVWNIVCFQHGDTSALALANHLIGKSIGKFWLDENGCACYKLEFSYHKHTIPQHFEKVLRLGLNTVRISYEAWMKERWSETRPHRPAPTEDLSSTPVEKVIEESFSQRGKHASPQLNMAPLAHGTSVRAASGSSRTSREGGVSCRILLP